MHKVWLIIGVCLILAGILTFTVIMSLNHWDFQDLSTVKYETREYTFEEDIQDISIETTTSDIQILPSEESTCKVVCYEQEKLTHSVTTENGTLTISPVDNRRWYDHIGIFNLKAPKITVYLPETVYTALMVVTSTGDVTVPEDFQFDTLSITATTGDVHCNASVSGEMEVTVSTGDIRIADLTAGNVTLTMTTGDIQSRNVSCSRFTCQSSTGDVKLDHLIASEEITVSSNTGDVKLDKCDAAELSLSTNTGDIHGSLLSGKVFTAQASTGEVDVPPSGHGGQCNISTSTGDIHITIEEN